MLTFPDLSSFVSILILGFYSFPPRWIILTHTHAFGLHPVLIHVGIAHAI